jgi:heme A synthase
MNRHPFDPIALVLGTLVCMAGIVAVADADPDVGSLPRWLAPLAVIAVGSVMVLGALLRTNQQAPALARGLQPASADESPATDERPATDEPAADDEPPADAV